VFSIFGRLAKRRDDCPEPAHTSVALCLRFRDEARYLREWLDYYYAAGVSHFFLYNNFSEDNYRDVLAPYVERGLVTVIEWSFAPASPAAEEDCILRARGQYKWVGFFDADEFVVIKDHRSIPEFLDGYNGYPGVALHWLMFGSSRHVDRPGGPVIEAYAYRGVEPNFHVKCFVRADAVAQWRNTHSWYFRGMSRAVNELRRSVTGTLSVPVTAEMAWINHYHSKSEEDYREKMARRPQQDDVTMRFPNRRPEFLAKAMSEWNDIYDSSAVEYYRARIAIRAAGCATR
jgi:hypothetical protein